MMNHLQGAGFNVTDPSVLTRSGSDSEPDYDDYDPPNPSGIHEHEGEQNTRQNVTLHPKDVNSIMQGGDY